MALSLLRAFPGSSLYTSLYNPSATYPEFADFTVKTLPINRIRHFQVNHRRAFPLLPLAWSTARIAADVVLCSTSGWSHFVGTSGSKIAYCHTPARWLYEPSQLFPQLNKKPKLDKAYRVISAPLRAADRAAAATVTRYLCQSRNIRGRIRRAYGIDAEVIPAPHTLGKLEQKRPHFPIPSSYFLSVSRLLPYKKVLELAVAFDDIDQQLVLVGDGPLRNQINSLNRSNVTLLSGVTDSELRWLYKNSTALIAISEEDYGLTPLEAASFGRPTIALRGGGYLDTVVPNSTGIFIESAEPSLIRLGVKECMKTDWDHAEIEKHAAAFNEPSFIESVRSIVEEVASRPI